MTDCGGLDSIVGCAGPDPVLRRAGPVAVGRLGAALARTARDQDQDLVFARTDHEYFRQHLTLRYIDQQFAGQAVDATRFQPAISSDGRACRERDQARDRSRSAIGSKVVNEARLQCADSHDAENSGNDACRSSSGRAGASSRKPVPVSSGLTPLHTKRLQMADSVSWVAGGHSLKAGVDVLKDRNATQFGPQTTNGFQTIAGFATGSPDWQTRTFDTGAVHADMNAVRRLRPGHLARQRLR